MSNRTPNVYISELGPLARTWWLFRRAWIAAIEDNCFGIAKGAAYSALLSLFPVLTTVTALLVQANAEAVSRVITKLLFEVAPPGTQDLLGTYLRAHGHRPLVLLVTATVLSIWGASGAMISLMEGFQAAYSLPGGRSMIRQRAMAMLLVVCAVVPLVFGSTLLLFGSRWETAMIHWLGLSTPDGMELAAWVVILSRLLRSLCAFGCITLAAALLYYLGPNRRIRFVTVWPGALIASLLWLISTQLFAWYVRNLANYNVLYGSVAAAIALLVWMYVLAVVALVGCEFNVAAENDALVRKQAVSVT